MEADAVLSQNSLKTMQLNDQKAGMQGLDKEAINKIIYEASKGTPYFIHQEKRQQRIDRTAKEMLEELGKATESQRKESLAKMDALCAALEAERDLSRSIVHIDMDAFYAAVEMLDNPDLKSKPMAVGSLSMLSTSNYEARKYGVRAAMAGFIAKKLCPELTIVPCRFDRYREISKLIRNVIKDYDPDYSPMGLDEVYLDLTNHIKKVYSERQQFQCCCDHKTSSPSPDEAGDYEVSQNSNCQCINVDMMSEERDSMAFEIVEEIRKKIFEATNLTASAGIAPNTRLAKVCSDQNKPNGQYQIKSNEEEVKRFIEDLPIKKISGIGPVQGQLLNKLGIYTCGDMWRKRDVVDLLFSPRSTRFYMKVALGIGSTEVKSDYVRKSIGNEETFREMHKPEEQRQKCEELCDEMIEHMKTRDLLGKVVVLKIKTSNFEVHTRNFTLPEYTSNREMIVKAANRLLDGEIKAAAPQPLRLRLMGIRMANLVHGSEISDSKQAKIRDFLQMKAPVPSKPSPVASISRGCPVCGVELGGSAEDFNLHVNQCLNSLQTPAESFTESSVPKHDANDTTNTSGSSHQLSLTFKTKIKPSEDIEHERLTCPVCGAEQLSSDLLELNSHIDSCLNRVAIKELLSSDGSASSNSNKRKLSPTKICGKKSRVSSHKLKTIEHYFQQ